MEPGMSSNVLWRQFGQSLFPHDNEMSLPPQPLALPIPNAALRESSAINDIGAFFAIGEAWAHVVSHFLPENPILLDIGCGCGKLARFLYLNLKVRYIGVDLFLPAIDWCRREFGALAGDRFRFEHFDGISAIYNPSGSIRPRDYRLPVMTTRLTPSCAHPSLRTCSSQIASITSRRFTEHSSVAVEPSSR